MSGLTLGEAMSAEIIGTVVTQTQFGLVFEIRCVLALAVAACLGFDRHPMARALGLAASLCLVAAIAATGHAGSTQGAAGLVHLAADAIHLVAAAAWIGGVVSLALLITVAHVPAKWDPVRRQGHAPTPESTALPGDIGSPSDPISPGSAVVRRADAHAWPVLVRDATERFSMLAMLSVGALLATGIVNGWILVARCTLCW